jgi:V/A-type H+-transporting ATPase subunit I
MFLPAKMSNVTAIVYDTDVEKVTGEILRLGMLQLVDATEVQEWAGEMSSVVNEEMIEKYTRLEERIKSIGAKLGRPIEMKAEKIELQDLDVRSMTEELDEAEEEADSYITRKRFARQEIGRLMSLLSEAKRGFQGGLPVDVHGPFSFLEARAVKISDKNVPVLHSLLKGIPSVVLQIGSSGDKRDCLVMVLRKDRRVLEDALKEISFTKIDLPEKGEEDLDENFAVEIREKIMKEERDLDDANRKLAGIADEKMSKLSEFLGLVHTRKVIHQAQHHFKKTSRTYLISGWIPISRKKKLISRIESLTDGQCYIEEVTAEELGAKVEVPVMFQNPSFLKPFEMLTGGYGLPRYNTIDPTLFLAVSFLAMFGAMFGDVGHGGILALIGLLAFKKSSSEEFRRLGGLMLYAGVSAVVFGFVYGSFFGPKHLSHMLPYEGFEPMRNIQTLLRIAVYFGISFLTLGIILNIVNSIRTRDFFAGVFSKEGLIGGVIYWIAIILIARFFTHGIVGIGSRVIILLIFGPMALFFLRGPIKKLFRPREPMFHEGFGLYLIESIIEFGEIYMRYLANTMSFIRVGAFALAHGALFIAVYAITSKSGIIGSIPVHIIMNAVIIALEGLIVTIQAVRLEYYEFFGKFFRSGSRGYEPSNMTEVR